MPDPIWEPARWLTHQAGNLLQQGADTVKAWDHWRINQEEGQLRQPKLMDVLQGHVSVPPQPSLPALLRLLVAR